MEITVTMDVIAAINVPIAIDTRIKQIREANEALGTPNAQADVIEAYERAKRLVNAELAKKGLANNA